MPINLQAAWIGFLLGVFSGALMGLRFAHAGWMGGYDSWARRMVRLGHISFFGLGFLNLALYMTVATHGMNPDKAAGWLFIVGAVTMPLVCFASAWRKPLRHAFFVPVVSTMTGIAIVVCRLVT